MQNWILNIQMFCGCMIRCTIPLRTMHSRTNWSGPLHSKWGATQVNLIEWAQKTQNPVFCVKRRGWLDLAVIFYHSFPLKGIDLAKLADSIRESILNEIVYIRIQGHPTLKSLCPFALQFSFLVIEITFGHKSNPKSSQEQLNDLISMRKSKDVFPDLKTPTGASCIAKKFYFGKFLEKILICPMKLKLIN